MLLWSQKINYISDNDLEINSQCTMKELSDEDMSRSQLLKFMLIFKETLENKIENTGKKIDTKFYNINNNKLRTKSQI